MSRANSLRSICGSACAALLLVGCHASRPADGNRRYTIAGTVVERDEIHSRLTIAHDAVSGLMPAMTMPFRVANLAPAVQPGDQVRGTLVVTSDDGWIEGLTVTKKSDGSFTAPKSTDPEAGVEVPNFALRNQDGHGIGLRQFRGQYVVLTFIYTRCPFPDYCPLMMKNFNAILAALPKDVHLLSVSIDPGHDTPAVLRAYGERTIHGRDPFAHWDLATGSAGEIRRMAGWFGLTYFEESGQITHGLVTAIIDPGGKVARVLRSNTWRPEEVLAVLNAR
jgi:protein SCO1/2